MEYFVLRTNLGWIGLLASARGLSKVTLPLGSAQEALMSLGDEVDHATWSPGGLADLASRFRDYFAGHRVTFTDELDLLRGTPFQEEVCRVTRLIPYGETRSYNWVAERMGRPGSVRAVGQALARNPLPIVIPCHRVVRSDGKLGGFTGGLKMKRKLLDLESAKPAK